MKRKDRTKSPTSVLAWSKLAPKTEKRSQIKWLWPMLIVSAVSTVVVAAQELQPQTQPPLTVLYSFGTIPDPGYNPNARLFLATDGNFYGTDGGGRNLPNEIAAGTVFKLTPSGAATPVFTFMEVMAGTQPELRKEAMAISMGQPPTMAHRVVARCLS